MDSLIYIIAVSANKPLKEGESKWNPEEGLNNLVERFGTVIPLYSKPTYFLSKGNVGIGVGFIVKTTNSLTPKEISEFEEIYTNTGRTIDFYKLVKV